MAKRMQKLSKWSAFWRALTCCFRRKKRSSEEDNVSFFITDWDPCELDRVRVDDFSRLFLDDTSIKGGCSSVEVIVMVHRTQEEGNLLEDVDQPRGEEGEGRGDNNGGPWGEDLGKEAHATLYRNVEKQHGTLEGLSDQEHGGKIAQEQEPSGILERPLDNEKEDSWAQGKGQPMAPGEPVGDEEQGSEPMAGGDHARLQPLTGQGWVKEVPLHACGQKKACQLLISQQQPGDVRAPVTILEEVPVGQKILLPCLKIFWPWSCIWLLVATSFLLYSILSMGLLLCFRIFS